VPQSWTPDQIRQFQDYWDTEFAGDLAKRRRAKFVPGESVSRVHQTKEPEHKDEFDEWLARIICFAFSVPPQWAVKTMNRATADNQSAQAEAEGLEPTKEWVKDLIDEILADEFASPDLELAWLDEDDGDPETVLEGRLKVGALTLNEMRDALGLDPYDNAAADRPMVLTATGFVPIEANAGGEGASDGNAGANGQSANVETQSAKPMLGKASPDDAEHPGWPKGTPGGRGGKFRPKDDQGGEAPANSASIVEEDSRPKTHYAALSTDTLTDESASGSGRETEGGGQRRRPAASDNSIGPSAEYAQLNVQNNAITGNPLVDRTTDILLQTLAKIHALAGDGSGPWYGTRIHLMFKNDVILQNLPGIGRNGVEQSFSLGDIAEYGEDGTVRVDVYMRDGTGKVVAIWDVKTGGAVLTAARVRQLRAEVGVGSGVWVIELHVTRGATLKARTWRSVLNVIAVIR
jgi:hypothetical protein